MLLKVSRVAEQMATTASRREFLGRLGQGALTVAATLGGLLALPGAAEAGRIAACDLGSVGYCRGKKQGDRCRVGRYSGICLGAPLCYCRIASGAR
jgi:hypothetical protein